MNIQFNFISFYLIYFLVHFFFTFFICLFKLVHLNGLLFHEWVDHVVKELNFVEALKSSIFVVQKANAPKNGVEFRQGSYGTIKISLAMLYAVLRRRARVPTF